MRLASTGTVRDRTNKNARPEPGAAEVDLPQFVRNSGGRGAFAQGDRRAAEAATGQAGAENAREIARNLDQQIEFRGAVLEILAGTLV